MEPQGLTDQDEQFVHAPARGSSPIPRGWRESCFFVAHPREGPGDALILTVVNHPARRTLECLQLGRVDKALIFARHTRRLGTGLPALAVGPAAVQVVAPYRSLRLRVDDAPDSPIALDLRFTARTRPYALSRHRLEIDGEVVWEQEHIIQSGWYDGHYVPRGRQAIRVERWWGQRDHSWGIRNHLRAPMWMWLAIQLPDGMLGVWCWERADGQRVYTDGCWGPADGADPMAVVGFDHDLWWTDGNGRRVDYGRDGTRVEGLAGQVGFRLADGSRILVEATGRWIARYQVRGGGQQQAVVRTTDGRVGTGIYEITGRHHRRYFPAPRATWMGVMR